MIAQVMVTARQLMCANVTMGGGTMTALEFPGPRVSLSVLSRCTARTAFYLGFLPIGSWLRNNIYLVSCRDRRRPLNNFQWSWNSEVYCQKDTIEKLSSWSWLARELFSWFPCPEIHVPCFLWFELLLVTFMCQWFVRCPERHFATVLTIWFANCSRFIVWKQCSLLQVSGGPPGGVLKVEILCQKVFGLVCKIFYLEIEAWFSIC
jgi:hypothetical protein